MWITGSYDPDANLVYWGVSSQAVGPVGPPMAIRRYPGELVGITAPSPGETNDMDDQNA